VGVSYLCVVSAGLSEKRREVVRRRASVGIQHNADRQPTAVARCRSDKRPTRRRDALFHFRYQKVVHTMYDSRGRFARPESDECLGCESFESLSLRRGRKHLEVFFWV